jgi:hypothetical protein
MAITSLGAYALQPGTSSATLVPPGSSAAADMSVIFAVNKLSTNVPADPSGYTPIDSQIIGTGSDGAGTGPLRITAWFRILTAAAANVAISVPSGNALTAGGQIYRKSAGETWAIPTMRTGSDTTSGTGFSASMASQQGIQINDWVYSIGATSANSTNPSARVISIPGCTSTVAGINSGGTANGNDLFVWTDHDQITAGAQSGVGVTSGTLAVASTGGAAQIRVALANAGTLAGTVSAQTASMSGTVSAGSATGTLAATVAAQTASMAGVGSAGGTLSGGLSAQTASLAAAAKITSTLAGALQAMVASMSGSSKAAAALAGTVAAQIASMAGQAAAAGTLSGSMAAQQASMVAQAELVATLSGQLSSVLADMQGQVEIPFAAGTLDAVVSAMEASFAGDSSSAAELAGTLAEQAAIFEAAATVTAELAGTLSAVEADFTGVLIGAFAALGHDLVITIQSGTDSPVSIETGSPSILVEQGTTERAAVVTGPPRAEVTQGTFQSVQIGAG